MKVGLIFPFPELRNIEEYTTYLSNLKKPNEIEVKIYPISTATGEGVYLNHNYVDEYIKSEVWEKIRLAREEGFKTAIDENCDWVIHHDFLDMFKEDYFYRLKETLESGLSKHYSSLSWYKKQNRICIADPMYTLDYNHVNQHDIDWQGVLHGDVEVDRYYYVRRGYAWIWHRDIFNVLCGIPPNSEEDRRDEGWREILWEKDYKCVLDTKLINVENSHFEVRK